MSRGEKPLAGKVAVVTGASQNIGRAIGLAYARAGARVCCAARSREKLEETVARIEAEGGEGLAVVCDVTDADQVERMMATAVERYGGLDILVINAGGNIGRGAVEECDPADWLATLDVNLNGAFHCAQKGVPHMKRRGGGKIIATGSGMGHRGMVGGAAYCCAKAGLWMLVRVLADELRAYDISVNELIPGRVAGEDEPTVMPAREPDPANPFTAEWLKAPEDVAPMALFLATQPATGPTGQSFSLMRRQG